MLAEYGHVIVDEGHHVSAQSFELVLRQAKAKYITGLSATFTRKDGHHPIVFMQCGPVRHRVDAEGQAAARPFEHLVLVQPTAFQPRRGPDSDKRVELQALCQELVEDELRNRRICDDIVESVDNSPQLVTTNLALRPRVVRFADQAMRSYCEHRPRAFWIVQSHATRVAAH